MKELPYFYIDGLVGGNQDWFLDPWMHLGGCGALTACDLCLQQAIYGGARGLYPYDLPDSPDHLLRRDYVHFGMRMKRYLRPRHMGINKTSLFVEGFQNYLADCGETGWRFDALQGSAPVSEAAAAVIERIDAGVPVPFLTLMHRDPKFEDFNWHWYIVAGYRIDTDRAGGTSGPDSACAGISVKAITYGEETWLPLDELWNTGYEERGGIVLVQPGR